MSSYVERLATELRNAYEAHDRDAFDRALKRMADAMVYAGPVPSTRRAIPVPTCTRFGGCVCTTGVQVALCMHRRPEPDLEPSSLRRPHGTVDGDYCPECGFTCNLCACRRYAEESPR
jgi:hypothetical protein